MERLPPFAQAICAIALFALALPAPLGAEEPRQTVIDGRCQYPQTVTEYRQETTLILCDTVEIDRSRTIATLDFTQRSWGSMARFAGDMPGDTMTISRITLRDGRTRAATGTCKMFPRADGSVSVISCLAKAGGRSVAANFVPSRF